MLNVGQLAVRVKVLHPEDSLGKAAEAVRSSTVGAAPVVRDGMLIGLITAPILTEFLTAEGSPRSACTIASLPLQPAVALPASLGPLDALRFFRANGLERAPVLESTGEVLGMVSQAELATAVCGRVRPPMIGGMATPFGVYLAGGGVRGGVGDFALVTTGVYLGALQCAAWWIADALLSGSWINSMPAVVSWLDSFPSAFQVIPYLIFAMLFRLSWITGFHAAEHQVVHAIEAGDDLKPDVVARKPRVHPRCGTNIVAAVLLAQIFLSLYGDWSKNPNVTEVAPILAVVGVAVFWRRFGGFLQQYVTTRPATPGQIASGIHAARQLMERYQLRPYGARSAFQRIWDMGMLQVMLGFGIVMLFIMLLKHLGVPVPFTF